MIIKEEINKKKCTGDIGDIGDIAMQKSKYIGEKKTIIIQLMLFR